MMPNKSVSITREAYEALRCERAEGESFTDVVLRLTRETRRLSACYGAWQLIDVKEARIGRELAEGWRRLGERKLMAARRPMRLGAAR